MHYDQVKAIDYHDMAPYLIGLFFAALVAFWPTYLSLPFNASSSYTHIHAVSAVLWMLLLIMQPILIKTGRLALYRAVGKLSYFLAPLLVFSVLLLAHNRIRLAPAELFGIQTYILYLQVSLALVFSGLYIAGIWFKRNMRIHSRMMFCTAVTLIDPIAIRIMFWVDPTPAFNYQWVSFALTDLVMLVLLWADRRNAEARSVLMYVLLALMATQAPALLEMTGTQVWQSFAAWYVALPLT